MILVPCRDPYHRVEYALFGRMAVRGVLEIELGWECFAECSQRHPVAKPALVLSMRSSYPEGTLPVGATGPSSPLFMGKLALMVRLRRCIDR
jgi:hypothetical protein